MPDLCMPEYLEKMKTWSATDRQTWGGCSEAVVLSDMYSCQIEIYEQSPQGFHLLARTGTVTPLNPAPARLFWDGQHYNTLIVK